MEQATTGPGYHILYANNNEKKTETYKTDRRMEGRTDTWTDGHPKRIYDRLSRGRRVQGIHRRTCANVLY